MHRILSGVRNEILRRGMDLGNVVRQRAGEFPMFQARILESADLEEYDTMGTTDPFRSAGRHVTREKAAKAVREIVASKIRSQSGSLRTFGIGRTGTCGPGIREDGRRLVHLAETPAAAPR